MNKLKQLILISRIKKGDNRAFQEVYRMMADKVYRFIFFRLPNETESEDVLQNVFLKFWSYAREDKSEVKNLSALLYRLAKNEVADYYRSRARDENDHSASLETVDLEAVEYKLSDDKHLKVDWEMDLKINIKNIREKISHLENDEYREVIELRFFDDLSHKEIAEIMDKPEKNVRVLLHRAVKKLKELMQK